MCYSAEASFSASAVLSTVGVLSYRKASVKNHRLLALIPIFFGIQQFSEGIVWVAVSDPEFSPYLNISTQLFIFFAWIIWPIYNPYCLWKVESDIDRKKKIYPLMYLGVLVATILSLIIAVYGVYAEVEDCSIAYIYNFEHRYGWMLPVLYVVATVFPFFISSLKRVWIVGMIYFVSYFFTRIYFDEHLISIWCFVAAIASLLIYWIVSDRKEL